MYRARDERLKRDVAVKVLPATYSADAERLRRFEQEAQAAGALNHPNITAVHDLGSHDGAPYIVTELLEGETLRGRLSGGALSVRKATDYAIQTAKGLAAAHEKGIVHRDLKPENLFVTNDGRVKILDFGLAKLTQADGAAGPQTNLPTAAGTEPGVVMGTLGYMSPEQVKGKSADARSDIFSFGAILYEMLSGSRAFHRDTAAETMSAILREEPPDLSATNKSVQPGLERVVRHCLEKSPEERFHSAHDLAFDLESISGTSASAITARPAVRLALPAAPAPRRRARRRGAAGRRLLLRQVEGCLGAPDIQAAHVPQRRDLGSALRFRRQVDSHDRGVGRKARRDLRQPSGEPGVARRSACRAPKWPRSRRRETLPSSSGPTPTPPSRAPARWPASVPPAVRRASCSRKSQFADWSPDGKELLIVRPVEGKTRLEYPAGEGPLRDQRLDRQSAHLAGRRADRLPGSSRHQRRRRNRSP